VNDALGTSPGAIRTDEQGRLNWRNLVEVVGTQPRVVTAERARFERLFVQLGLPARELEAVIQGPAASLARTGRPGRTPAAPAAAGRFLQALGLSASTLRAVEPLTTWLPAATPLNANTAPAAVLQAAVPGLDAGAAQRLIEQRARQHFATTEAFLAALGRAGQSLDPRALERGESLFSRHRARAHRRPRGRAARVAGARWHPRADRVARAASHPHSGQRRVICLLRSTVQPHVADPPDASLLFDGDRKRAV
jgi:hypothetical protein